ncbi:hypothetical protein L6452_25312 [Arctium lappa]|uniref:Uncharacterized protein n=1 Tax=Arctium lappa TaxID=4217 RepID=A0ACB9AB76_ARCLA|nr:hypothetical protein L6452_25312 [Arctium lappa]
MNLFVIIVSPLYSQIYFSYDFYMFDLKASIFILHNNFCIFLHIKVRYKKAVLNLLSICNRYTLCSERFLND